MIFVLLLLKFGFFDKNKIVIENFVIEKPIFYRSLVECSDSINLVKSSYLCSISFLEVYGNKHSFYTLKKEENNETFHINVKYNFELNNLNLQNINLDICYINKNELLYDDKYLVGIYKYPYIIKMSEINQEREKAMIKQFCGTSKIINIDIPSEN
jgi:hypothetical protein